MNIEKIKITNHERKLTKGELEKAISIIETLPENTFLSKKEGSKKGSDMPIYMKANELKIEYSQNANLLLISSRGIIPGNSIYGISAPENSEYVHATRKGVAFSIDENRYIVRF